MKRKLVAQLAGVSEATVSRVLSGSAAVKEPTRRRVLEAVEELGYVPSSLARQFAKRKSGNLGVVLPYLPKVHLFSTYYFSEILGGISETARREGADLLLVTSDPLDEAGYDGLFGTRKVDALILLGSRDQDQERAALRELELRDRPYVLVNQRMDGLEHRTVEADHRDGSRLAALHLLDEGWERPVL